VRLVERLGAIGEREIDGTDDAIFVFEESRFKNTGELAHIAGPVVLQQASQSAGAQDDGALLVAGADLVEEELREGCDVFAALAQWRNDKTDGGEPEGKIREQKTLASHLAERGLRGRDEDSAAGGTVLERLEDSQEEPLAGRREQVDAIEIGKAYERGGIAVGGEPLARVAALKAGAAERRMAKEIARKRVLAGAVFAFNGGDLEMRRSHLSLGEEFAPGCANAYDVDGSGFSFELNKREADGSGVLDLSGTLHRAKCASPRTRVCRTYTGFIDGRGKNMKWIRDGISTGRRGAGNSQKGIGGSRGRKVQGREKEKMSLPAAIAKYCLPLTA